MKHGRTQKEGFPNRREASHAPGGGMAGADRNATARRILVLTGRVASLLLALATASCATTFRASPPPPLAAIAAGESHCVVADDVKCFDNAHIRGVVARIDAPDDLDAPAPVIVFANGLGNSMNGYAYPGFAGVSSSGVVLKRGELPQAIAGVARLETGKGQALRVGSVTVRTTRVFSAADEKRGGFYRAADVLAVQTRESLIRKFLLFHEGEPFDESRLLESERNLRALDFLMSANVTPGKTHDGLVDVLVETQDAWTTEPNVDFSNDGGRSLYDIDIAQKNLFGSGAEADLRFANGRERRTASVELLDPMTFGAYWNSDLLYAKSSDGNEEKLAIERPLFSHFTHQTLKIGFDHLVQNARIYQFGQVASLFRQEHRQITVTAGRALFRTSNGAARLLYGADLISDSFQPLRGAEPENRHFHFLELGADMTDLDYVKLDHVDFGIREQDFNLGPHASILGGWSPPIHGLGVVWRIRSDASMGVLLAPARFVLTTLNASARAGDSNHNAIISSDTRYVARLETVFPQAFVSRLRIDRGSDIDRDVQFFADGQNGLRAYPNFAFTGSNRVVVNAEHRLYLGHELIDIFEPGAAIFVDSGRAGRGPFRTDFGGGARVSIARLDSAILRFDVAYALNRSPLSRRGVVFSFATSQAF